MDLIVDRNDYMTKEEYQKLLEKWDDISNLVEYINDKSYTNRYYEYRMYKLNNILFFIDNNEDMLSIEMYNENQISKIGIEKEILKEINLNIRAVGQSFINIYGYKVWELFEKLKDYEKIKYDIEYYKNKIIDVEKFNEKEYFKDIYELMSNIN